MPTYRQVPNRNRSLARGISEGGSALTRALWAILRMEESRKNREQQRQFQKAYLDLAQRREMRETSKFLESQKEKEAFKKDFPFRHMSQEMKQSAQGRSAAIVGARSIAQMDPTEAEKAIEELRKQRVDLEGSTGPSLDDLRAQAPGASMMDLLFTQQSNEASKRAKLDRIAKTLELVRGAGLRGLMQQGPALPSQGGQGSPTPPMPGQGGMLPPSGQMENQAANQDAIGALEAKQAPDGAEVRESDMIGLGAMNEYARIIYGQRAATPEERMAAMMAFIQRYAPGLRMPLALQAENYGSPLPQSPVNQIKDQNKPYSVRRKTNKEMAEEIKRDLAPFLQKLQLDREQER